ncbi:hypothetical protein [Kitasatospora griseola]|uniref:hypothetical protein n=1 Tax=Kitasatospora griseola TaxID=2064 RepID=UPI00382026C1
MNLAWIVAVLRPRDIAPHPNFSSPEYDSQSVARLAGIVSGSRYFRDHNSPSELDEGVRNAELTLTTDGIRVGLNALVREILSGQESDEARLCALGLLACCAAAELDDYETCDLVLDSLLNRVSLRTHSGRLLRAILLVQQSLRWRDSGRTYDSKISEALDIINRIEVDKVGDFSLSPGAAVDALESISQIVTSIRHSAWSLNPQRGLWGESPLSGFPSWQQVVKTPRADQEFKIDQVRASEYSKQISGMFSSLFRNRSKTISASGSPSLFHVALGLELLGNAAVYDARKEHALLRLVQLNTGGPIDPRTAADAIRLLRHSNAKSELDLTLEWLRHSGPLAAIIIDVQQILQNRSTPRMIREVELIVLRAGADLITPEESEQAFDLSCRVIAAGGAQPGPGSRPVDIARLEPAWITAAQLANSAKADGKAARLLIQAARSARSETVDETWDRGIGRALIYLDWDNVDAATKTEWLDIAGSMPAVESTLEFRSVAAPSGEKPVQNLEDVANRLNSAMSGSTMHRSEVDTCLGFVRNGMKEIRLNASRGTWSFRSLDVADIAAALITTCGATDLWDDLAAFLTDSRLRRSDTSRALSRLAQTPTALPEHVASVFREASENLLHSLDDFFEHASIDPHPAALRFLATHGVIEEEEVFALVANLSGSRESSYREEAARTLAAISAQSTNSWVISLSMQLSHDEEVNVRAHAARSLVIYSSSNSSFVKAPSDRVVEMTKDEGILVPLLIIREIGNGATMSGPVREAIHKLSSTHPSSRVRREAREILEQE